MAEMETNFPLTSLNTFGVPAKASSFAVVKSSAQAVDIIQHVLPEMKDVLILGGGSNILFTSDFDGLVLHQAMKGISVLEETDKMCRLKVAAGEDWTEFVDYCVSRGWGGIENLAMIPGQVGAAPVQNIGAYGREVKDVIEQVEALDLKTGEYRFFSNQECNFAYRNSIFKNELKNQYLITHVIFSLHKEPVFYLDYGSIRDELENQQITEITFQEVARAIKSIRSRKLPDVNKTGSAGSFFKNPLIAKVKFETLKEKYPAMPFFKLPEGYKIPAGWLIDQCGWKGHTRKNYGVYPEQALVLVNYGGASGKDIFELSEEIRQDVSKKFDVELEREVTVI
ncbi:MAG: UDP-N-acetylmuramate dehydrogenase [Bacteroidota bacterium]